MLAMCSPGRYCCWAEGHHRAQIVCSCWRAVAVFPGEADTRWQRAQQYPWAQWWRHGVPIQASLLPHCLQLAEWVTGGGADQVGSWDQGVFMKKTETNLLFLSDCMYFQLLHRISLCLSWRRSFSKGLASNLLCLSVMGRHLMQPLMVWHCLSIR